VARKGVGGSIWCKCCVHMYVNAKMIPVETVPGSGGGENKGERWAGVNSSMTYLIHCKNYCKCHSAPPPSPTI
jgi:hypothetical protein